MVVVAHVHVKLGRADQVVSGSGHTGGAVRSKAVTAANIQSRFLRVVPLLLPMVSAAHGNRHRREGTKKGGAEVRSDSGLLIKDMACYGRTISSEQKRLLVPAPIGRLLRTKGVSAPVWGVAPVERPRSEMPAGAR